MKKTLLKIAEHFNESDISWAVGASYLLKLHNIVEQANDLDILVLKSDLNKAASILNKLGKEESIEKMNKNFSRDFYKFKINGVEVDLFADLLINYNNKSYNFQLKKESITDFKKINAFLIPLASLEDWYILYSLMTGKEKKIKLLENHFEKHGIKNPEILEKNLEKALPEKLKQSIVKLLR